MKYLFIILFACSCLSLKTKNINMSDKKGKCDTDYLMEIASEAIIKEYGKKTYNKYKPYKIKDYDDSTYIIDGTIKTKKGGAPTVFIDKEKCTIKEVTHYK